MRRLQEECKAVYLIAKVQFCAVQHGSTPWLLRREICNVSCRIIFHQQNEVFCNFRLRRRLFVGLTSESSGHLSNSDCRRQSRSCLKYTHNIHFNHHTKKCILVAVFYSVWESCKPPDQSCPTCAINDIVKMKRMRTWQRSRSLASSNHFIRGDQPELNYFHVLRVAGTTASTRCGNILTLH